MPSGLRRLQARTRQSIALTAVATLAVSGLIAPVLAPTAAAASCPVGTPVSDKSPLVCEFRSSSLDPIWPGLGKELEITDFEVVLVGGGGAGSNGPAGAGGGGGEIMHVEVPYEKGHQFRLRVYEGGKPTGPGSRPEQVNGGPAELIKFSSNQVLASAKGGDGGATGGTGGTGGTQIAVGGAGGNPGATGVAANAVWPTTGLFAGFNEPLGGGGGGSGAAGGPGGGGAGGSTNSPGAPGVAGTGGGGGGGNGQEKDELDNDVAFPGGAGGSGVIIVRFLAAPAPAPDPPAPAPDPPAPAPDPPAPAPDPPAPVALEPVLMPAPTSSNEAVVLVGGEQVSVTVSPLTRPSTASNERPVAASLPPRLQRELPPVNGAQLTVGESSLSFEGPQLGGSGSSRSSLTVAPGAPMNVAFSGFEAGSEVGIYLINEDGTFVLIGVALVDDTGAIRSSLTVPAGALSGAGRLQIQGSNASGSALTVAVDAQVLPPVAPVPTSRGELPTLRPGTASVINAEGEQLRAIVDQVNGSDIRIRSQQSTTNIQAVDDDGVRPLGSQGAIEVEQSGYVRIGGSGFQPNSMVEVWMFSDPSFVGIVETDASGNYRSLLQLPEELSAGQHTLQSAGTARNGTRLAAAAGLQVRAGSADPNSAEGSSAGTTQRQTLSRTVRFDRMSSSLTAADKRRLDRLAASVGNQPARITITGYVQASPDTSNDISLSTARARSVARYLRAQGVRGDYTVKGEGVLNAPSAQARSARVVIRLGR